MIPESSTRDPLARDPLARDIDLLGHALGAVLQEQSGPDFFKLEEDVRDLCKRLRANPNDTAVAARLEEIVQGLGIDQAEGLVRAFSHYFGLVNLAEERHRVRRQQIRAAENPDAVRPQSLRDAIGVLKRQGLNLEETLALMENLELGLTFTAHPTEMRRRTVRQHLEAIAHQLPALESASNDEAALALITAHIEALWGTLELHKRNPTVRDEVQGGLAYLGNIAATLGNLELELEEAIAQEYTEESTRQDRCIKRLSLPLKLYSWIGGDRDGNPNVTPQVTRETLALHNARARENLRESISALFAHLSAHRERVAIAPDFLPEALEPFRVELQTLYDALGTDHAPDPVPILERVVRGLEEAGQHRAARVFTRPVLAQARVFGRHLVTLDAREFSGNIEMAVAELLRVGGAHANYSKLNEQERVLLLSQELETRRPLRPVSEALPEKTAWVVEPLHAMRDAMQYAGPAAFGHFVISHASDVSDILEVLVLAREAGIAKIDVSPLFETLDDLENAPQVMTRLLQHPIYRKHLGERVQEVMIGYSDSNKEAGFLAANWALYQAQEKLAAVFVAHNVPWRFFHGRGTSIGRGGGPAARGILAQPPGTIGRGLRITEQGEALSERYANPFIAKRNLEQFLYALIVAASRKATPPSAQTVQAMQDAAHMSHRHYRALVEHPNFLNFFEAATPILEIASLKIASRPVRRPGPASLDNLRAIPWVMSWTQTRANIPGWYGLGTGLALLETHHAGLAAQLYTGWPFWRSLIDNAQMSLAKSDVGIYRRYAALAPSNELGAMIVAEWERTLAALKHITGHDLLANEPRLKRSIDLRNPYVDPLHFVQVELLRRYRALPEDHAERAKLERALMLSIQGIAAGLRNTG